MVSTPRGPSAAPTGTPTAAPQPTRRHPESVDIGRDGQVRDRISGSRVRERIRAGDTPVETRGARGGEQEIRSESGLANPGGRSVDFGTPRGGVAVTGDRGHGRRYDHDRGRNYYGHHSYRYTHNYNYYRYCGSGYYGNPYYWGDPWGHYDYVRLGLFFGFHGYYPYDRFYGYHGAPVLVVLDDGDPYQENVGALDLNVRPKDTEVYLNGHPIGEAGDFDGYPQLLWLEEGEYELIFYKEGYETQRRIYEVRTGLQINVKLHLEHGVSTLPDNLSHRYADPETFVPASEDAEPTVRPTIASAPETPPELDEYASVDAADVTTDGGLDTRQAPGRVRLEVEPLTASLYLDGRFIGTGEQVAGHLGALLVDAGDHLLEVVHPAYEPRELRFTVQPGEDLRLAVPELLARVEGESRTARVPSASGSPR